MPWYEIGGLMLLGASLVGLAADRLLDRGGRMAVDPCPRCRWPRQGVLPCLCPEGTEGRYPGSVPRRAP